MSNISDSQLGPHTTESSLRGKRAAMVMFSTYPYDARPRRAVKALLNEGMMVDLICLRYDDSPAHEALNGLDILRLPITHRRNSLLIYAWNYSVFILITATILALRAVKRRYDLVYIHNMPDILVLTSLVPKMLGAKVLLDLHDPMPELMMTVFSLKNDSLSVRMMRQIEKWSIAWASFVVTTNIAFEQVFTSRSCSPEKICVVMNSPDEQVFPFRGPRSSACASGVTDKRFVIMYHGTLIKRNGVDLAIEAFAQLIKDVPTAELRIFGPETPFLRRSMDSARRRGLEGRVRYLGPRSHEELTREIDNCSLGIIPNRQNGFTAINMPTRIFEYLTMGKPTIAPWTRGIQDYFAPDSLIFFEAGNADDLARKIEHVAFHYRDALDTVRRGQAVYLEHTWSQERRTLVGVVKKLLNGKESSSTSPDNGYHERKSCENPLPADEYPAEGADSHLVSW